MDKINLKKANWNRILIFNIVLTFLIFSPYLPINSYLHEFVIDLNDVFFLSALVLGALVGLILPIFFIFAVGLFLYLTTTDRFTTFWASIYSFFITILISYSIIISGYIQDFERDYIISTSGQEIIDALKAYKADHQEYPESIKSLVPKYLSKFPRKKVPASSNFYYTKMDHTFKLRFSFFYYAWYSQEVEYIHNPLIKEAESSFIYWRIK